jgi:hypothetical protein
VRRATPPLRRRRRRRHRQSVRGGGARALFPGVCRRALSVRARELQTGSRALPTRACAPGRVSAAREGDHWLADKEAELALT